MKTPCPHCQAMIEIDLATHAALAGQSHFACPACQGVVPVPAFTRPHVRLNPAPGVHATAPTSRQSASTASRKSNRNLLILGSAALLTLGGIAFVLASKKSGNTHSTTQNIRNEIINNSYFQNLIASGVTTMKNLDAVAEIRPYEGGFIGISKESLTWNQAQELAKRTGAEILAMEDGAGNASQKLLSWLAGVFSSNLSSPVWVSEHGEARILDAPDVLAVTTMDRPRKVLLQWSLASDEADFVTLFNGKDLSGWQSGGEHCFVRNGVIVLQELASGSRNHFLDYTQMFPDDFELRIKVRAVSLARGGMEGTS